MCILLPSHVRLSIEQPRPTSNPGAIFSLFCYLRLFTSMTTPRGWSSHLKNKTYLWSFPCAGDGRYFELIMPNVRDLSRIPMAAIGATKPKTKYEARIKPFFQRFIGRNGNDQAIRCYTTLARMSIHSMRLRPCGSGYRISIRLVFFCFPRADSTG